MANSLKGEVGFDADGKHYLLSFGINALCSLEDALDLGVNEVGAKLQGNVSVRLLRTVFWAGLQDHHAGLTEEDAGQLMTDVGLAPAGAMVAQAFAAAFPPAEAGSTTAGPRSPARKPGTGRGS